MGNCMCRAGAGECERGDARQPRDVHPDLTRILMPDEFTAFPLRKDYPVQLRKDAQTAMPLQVTEEEFKASM